MLIGFLLPMIMLFGQSKLLQQQVRLWPPGYDATGKHWVVYNFFKPITHNQCDTSLASLSQYSAANNYMRWTADIGNFNHAQPPTWSLGDTITALGSIDTVYTHDSLGYGTKVNHCGFYWIYSDTVLTSSPELWSPADTLRPMPKPIVFKRGLGGISDDTIIIRIPNPRETRRSDQTQYDVLGYLIYADTTGTGTPNAYNNATKVQKVKFLTAQGVYGDTTTYKILESNFCPPNIEWPVYFAYKLGAKPDTTVSAIDTSGYITYYFSQNSDSIHVLHNVVGVEEGNGSVATEPKLVISPNPFNGITKITIGHKANGVQLNIYDVSGQLVKSFGDLTDQQLPFNQIWWNGRNDAGNLVPAGVYFIEATTQNVKLTEKVILER